MTDDSLVGGRSEVRFRVIDDPRPGAGGAPGSRRSLFLHGEIEDRPPPRWAGAMWQPGGSSATPFDLSSRAELRFMARTGGAEGEYLAALFDRRRPFDPVTVTFTAGPAWRQVTIPLAEFAGIDLTQVTMLMLAAGPEAGTFELAIDDVRLDAGSPSPPPAPASDATRDRAGSAARRRVGET